MRSTSRMRFQTAGVASFQNEIRQIRFDHHYATWCPLDVPTWQPPNFEGHTVYRSKESKSRLDLTGSQTVFTQLKGRRTCPHRRPMIPSNSIGAVQGLSFEDVVLFPTTNTRNWFLDYGDRVENLGLRMTPQRPFNEERPSS